MEIKTKTPPTITTSTIIISVMMQHTQQMLRIEKQNTEIRLSAASYRFVVWKRKQTICSVYCSYA